MNYIDLNGILNELIEFSNDKWYNINNTISDPWYVMQNMCLMQNYMSFSGWNTSLGDT